MARQDERLQAAEDELIDCMRMLRSLPDRERGWLRSGQSSWWPTIVRDKIHEFWPDPDATVVQRNLSRRELVRMERMFDGAGCIIMRISEKNRRLVGVVAMRKAGHMPGGFRWEDIWRAMKGCLPTGESLPDGTPESRKVTSATMRARYEAALGIIADALARAAEGEG